MPINIVEEENEEDEEYKSGDQAQVSRKMPKDSMPQLEMKSQEEVEEE